MDMVERIKEICKDRKIPVYKLEKECGFSNGYLNSLKNGVLPFDRAKKVADYLEVTTDYLNGEEVTEGYYLDSKTAIMMQELLESPGRRALFDATRDMDEATVQKYADFIKGITDGNNESN